MHCAMKVIVHMVDIDRYSFGEQIVATGRLNVVRCKQHCRKHSE